MSTLSISSNPLTSNLPVAHYSCGTCGGECFNSIDSHREHYRSEWHRYNLKRRVAGLPPISKIDFATKSALFSSSFVSSGADTSPGRTVISNVSSNDISPSTYASAAAPTPIDCKQCNKHFSSNNSLADHLKSARHREAVKRLVELPSKSHTSPISELVSSPLTPDGTSISCVTQQSVATAAVVRESHRVPSPFLPPDPAIKSVNAPGPSPQKVKSSTQKKLQATAQKHWNPTRVLNRVASSTSDAENEWEDCDDDDEDEEEEEKEDDDQRVPDAAVPVLPGVPPSTEQKKSKPQERTNSKAVTLLLGDCLFCRTAKHKTPEVASTCLNAPEVASTCLNAPAEGGPTAKPPESTCASASASSQSHQERAAVEHQLTGRFRTVRALLSHMERAHMFLVPERDLCSDLPALLDFLRELVAEHHACLRCGQVFRSTHAVQQHMRARGHTRMLFEYELPEDEARVSDADRRIRALVEDYHEFYDFDGEGEANEEEADSDSKASEESDWLEGLTDEDAYELVLPTGAAIGHRSLRRYWRQRVPLRTPAQQKRSHLRLQRLLGPYRALGFNGQLAQLPGVGRGGALAAIAGQGAMSARGGVLVSRRTQQKLHKKQSLQALSVGMKGNIQMHYRNQYFI